jgi:PTS system nitrogen regulatory IIA component
MEIEDFLSPSEVMLDVRASDKARLLNELARQAAAKLDLAPDAVAAALLKREELGSTGTGAGIDPHARLEGVTTFGMLVRLARAIDFDAIDGRRSTSSVCCCCRRMRREQLNALACAARTLRDPDAVRDVRRAGDDAALYDAVVKSSVRSRPG